jgi:magnesium-transporting ATPase (P-type)
MSEKKAPFEWKFVYLPIFACVILSGIALAVMSNLPFALFRDYYTTQQLRPIEGNQVTLQLMSYGFALAFIVGNSLFFCFRSQVIRSKASKQNFFNIALLIIEAISLFAVFFMAPRHQVDRYWLVPAVSIIGSAIYIVLCVTVLKPKMKVSL